MRCVSVLLVAAVLFFVSCVPEQEDHDVAGFIDRQIFNGELCGDGIVQSWEFCDRALTESCNEVDPQKYVYGFMACSPNCETWDPADCYLHADCRVDICSSAGTCLPPSANGPICQCDFDHANGNCSGCATGYYRSEEGTCLPNITCAEAACNAYTE